MLPSLNQLKIGGTGKLTNALDGLLDGKGGPPRVEPEPEPEPQDPSLPPSFDGPDPDGSVQTWRHKDHSGWAAADGTKWIFNTVAFVYGDTEAGRYCQCTPEGTVWGKFEPGVGFVRTLDSIKAVGPLSPVPESMLELSTSTVSSPMPSTPSDTFAAYLPEQNSESSDELSSSSVPSPTKLLRRLAGGPDNEPNPAKGAGSAGAQAGRDFEDDPLTRSGDTLSSFLDGELSSLSMSFDSSSEVRCGALPLCCTGLAGTHPAQVSTTHPCPLAPKVHFDEDTFISQVPEAGSATDRSGSGLDHSSGLDGSSDMFGDSGLGANLLGLDSPPAGADRPGGRRGGGGGPVLSAADLKRAALPSSGRERPPRVEVLAAAGEVMCPPTRSAVTVLDAHVLPNVANRWRTTSWTWWRRWWRTSTYRISLVGPSCYPGAPSPRSKLD